MRRISLSLLAATAMGLIACQAASAADLGHPVYKAPPPAPPPVQDWSGIYVGLEAGYGWGKQDIDNNFAGFFNGKDPFPTSIGSVDQSGWLFGGFAGAQKQWGSWVLGIEADFDGADIKGTTTSSLSHVFGVIEDPLSINITNSVSLESKIDELGSVRGKVGWAWSPNWMIYGTGGVAFAHEQYDLTVTHTNSVFTGASYSDSLSGGASMVGWAAGAGLDWKWQIDQGSAWVLGVEYLHYEFPSDTLTYTDSFGENVAYNSKERVDTIKGRISYLFSIH